MYFCRLELGLHHRYCSIHCSIHNGNQPFLSIKNFRGRNQLNLLCSISNFAKILFSPLKFSLSNMPYNNVIVFSLRSSKITVNQTSACTALIFITTVANLRNCCILLCIYCVVLLAKQQGIKVNWLWKQMVLIYLIGHLPNFVTNLRVLQITYFLRVKSFTRNLRSSKTRQISCQAM